MKEKSSRRDRVRLLDMAGKRGLGFGNGVDELSPHRVL
jgi:hypothetical protein